MKRENQPRIEPSFRGLARELGVDHLLVKQQGEDAYTLIVQHPSEPIDYVLAAARRPHEGRIFPDFGRAVKYAVKITGLKMMRFDLFEDSGDAA